MTSFKRSFDDFSGFAAFQFPRNVRARLAVRHELHTSSSASLNSRYIKFQPILRKSAAITPESKENQDVNTFRSPLSRRRIRFYQKVAVHAIPARHQYSPEMKQRIWNSGLEIREMARRNTIEFASEGYDWRKAAEDDAMLVMPNGVRVHPVWKQRLEFEPTRNQPTRKQRRTTQV